MYRSLLVITAIVALAASASVNDTQNRTSQSTTIPSNDTQNIDPKSTSISANGTQNQTTELTMISPHETQNITSETTTTTTSSNETQQNLISDLKSQLQKLSNDTHLLISDVRKNLTQIDKSEQLTFDRFRSNNIRLKSSLTSVLANITDMRWKHTRLEQQYEALRKSYKGLQKNYDSVQQKIENDSNTLRSLFNKSASIERNITQQIMASNEVLQINKVMKTKIIEIEKDIPVFKLIFMNSLNSVANKLKKKVTGMAGDNKRKFQLLDSLKVRGDDNLSLKLQDLRKAFSLECPKDWEKIDNICYNVPTNAESLSHDMAAQKCEQEGATLATCRSREIDAYINKKMMFSWVWVGGRYMPSQTGDLWVWRDGTPIDYSNYNNWRHGIPVPPKDSRRCMYYWDRRWSNWKCDEKAITRAACEKAPQVILH